MQEMSKKRRNHSPEFKSKVAVAAIKGDQTLPELSQQYGINSNLIVKWKKQLIEQSNEVFASGKGLAPDRESEIQGLQAKIGQLTMGNYFLAKVLDR
jgi:transposase